MLLCQLAFVYDITRTYGKTLQRYADRPVVVMYYAPWCHECAAISDTYEALAETFDKKTAIISKVNCILNEQQCVADGVRDFPLFALYSAGKREVFDAKMSADVLQRWVRDGIGRFWDANRDL